MQGKRDTVMFVLSRWGLGGAERMTYEVARRLDRARYHVLLCCLKSSRTALQPCVVDHQGLLRSKWDPQVLSRLRQLIRHEGAGLVVTLGAGDAAFWGRLAGRLAGVPVLWWIHSMRDDIGRLNRALLPWTDGVISLSPKHRDFLLRRYRMPPHKVAVVPNGIDWAEYQTAGLRERMRASLSLPPEADVIGSVGGLRPVKGYEVLLQAALRVLQERPQSRFVIVGEGEQRAALTSLAEALGLEERVSFLGAREDVPQLLAAFDVYALSSHSEAFPLSALQAMAAGLPVVATDVGCLSEIVVPGETGVLVPPGRPEKLAAALTLLQGRPSEAQAMGRRGREVVRTRFPITRSVEEFERLVATLLR